MFSSRSPCHSAMTRSWHYSDDPEVNQEIGRESAFFDLAPKAALAYVEMFGDLWRIGDGNGGWLLNLVVEAAFELGITSERSRWQVPDRVQRIARRDGWECHYCGCALGWGHESVARPEIEHKTPRSAGGSNRLDNLVLACSDCNRRKGTKLYDDFLAEMRIERVFVE
jgi:hypothetical protein